MIETVGLDLPEEPPVGSVVLGNDNYAYQRMDVEDGNRKIQGWLGVIRDPYVGSGSYANWAALLVYKGPVRVIYRGEESG